MLTSSRHERGFSVPVKWPKAGTITDMEVVVVLLMLGAFALGWLAAKGAA